MPFERSAFARSVDKLVSTDGSAANGGVFTIGIQEAIDVAFGAVGQIQR